MNPTRDDLREAVRAVLVEGRRAGAFHHAAVAIRHHGEEILRTGEGTAADSVFDIASLTKAFTAALTLSRLGPDSAVPRVRGAPRAADLLAHRAGLPAWRPLFAHAARRLGLPLRDLVTRPELQSRCRTVFLELLAQSTVEAERPTYSDLGFLALGFALEDAAGRALPEFARERLFSPLRMTVTSWGGERPDALPTGRGRPREGNPGVEPEVTRGLEEPAAVDHAVDDDNAAVLGGAAGHAGIWSDAAEVALFGDHLRRAAEGEPSPLLSPAHARLLFTPAAGTRTYGLDTPSPEGSSLGSLLGQGPRGAAGHLGFTGCSMWIDRDAALTVVLLSDAVSVQRPNLRIREVRPRLHDTVARVLLARGRA